MKISVIIPVYNVESFIEKAVKSAHSMDCVDEIILVEDGSKDNSLEKCKELTKKHEKVRLFTHPNNENRGAGATRNLGIEKTTQEFISFLDADDFYLPHRFLKDKEIFNTNKTADAVYNAIGVHTYSKIAKTQFCKNFNINKTEIDNYLTTVNAKANPNHSNLFKGLIGLIDDYGYFHLNGLTVKKKSLQKMNVVFKNLTLHQDTDFLIRLAYYCKLYPSEINNAVAMRGVHENNRITNNKDINNSRFIQYNELSKWYTGNENQDEEVKNLLLYKIWYFKLNMKNKRSIFTCFNYSQKHPSIFFGEYKFGTMIASTTSFKFLVPIIVKTKNLIVSIFFKKEKERYSKANKS